MASLMTILNAIQPALSGNTTKTVTITPTGAGVNSGTPGGTVTRVVAAPSMSSIAGSLSKSLGGNASISVTPVQSTNSNSTVLQVTTMKPTGSSMIPGTSLIPTSGGPIKIQVKPPVTTLTPVVTIGGEKPLTREERQEKLDNGEYVQAEPWQKAEVWRYFDLTEDDLHGRRTICRMCGKGLSYNVRTTSTMRNHMKKKHPEIVIHNIMKPRRPRSSRLTFPPYINNDIYQKMVAEQKQLLAGNYSF